MKGWGIVLALALSALSTPAHSQTRAGAVQVDARAEVAAALYAASATQAATERIADERLRSAQAEIARLQSQGARARAALAEAQESYISELAARDRAFAQEIAVFRRAMDGIASTPDGTRALARFNLGDELGALAILDQLRAARDRARELRANIESATEGRQIATLALEARTRGRLDTASVIARFENVIRLDSGDFWDHINLCRLYVDAGRTSEARAAIARAITLATEDRFRVVALIDYGDILTELGDLEGALQQYEAALPMARAIAADSSNALGVWDLSVALSRAGDIRMALGRFAEAVPFYNEALTIDQDWHDRTRFLVAAQQVCSDLINLIDPVVALADLARAEQYAATAVRICEWVSTESQSAEDELYVAYARWRLANIKAALGDIPFAAEIFENLKEFAAIALQADSTNLRMAVEAQLIEIGLVDLDLLRGDHANVQERLLSVVTSLQDLRGRGFHRLVDTYVWLALVRAAAIPESPVTWAQLEPMWSANHLDLQNLSALDFHFVNLVRQSRRP